MLGHQVSDAGIESNSHKVFAVRGMLPPTNITKVKQFMDMVICYPMLIPDCYTVGEHLFCICRGKVPFLWGQEQEQSFESLKEALQNCCCSSSISGSACFI